SVEDAHETTCVIVLVAAGPGYTVQDFGLGLDAAHGVPGQRHRVDSVAVDVVLDGVQGTTGAVRERARHGSERGRAQMTRGDVACQGFGARLHEVSVAVVREIHAGTVHGLRQH